MPKPQNAAKEAFLAIGQGAAAWLEEAAASGVRGVASKMAEAVSLAKLRGQEPVDRALGTAATAGRFSDSDLRSILEHQVYQEGPVSPTRASADHSLQPGTMPDRLSPSRSRARTASRAIRSNGAAAFSAST